MSVNPIEVSPIDQRTGDVNVIVETPRGSRIKYKFDERQHLYSLGKVLPIGMVFPFDFGFIPSTRCEDGDPLDVLLFVDEPLFAGCLVRSRLIGAIEVRQAQENGEIVRNDRLLAVAVESVAYRELECILQLNTALLDEVEAFFDNYTRLRGKRILSMSRGRADVAKRLLADARVS